MSNKKISFGETFTSAKKILCRKSYGLGEGRSKVLSEILRSLTQGRGVQKREKSPYVINGCRLVIATEINLKGFEEIFFSG